MITSATYGNNSKASSQRKLNGELLATIEDLRMELIATVEVEGFGSRKVLELSQRLDKYIVEAQNQMLVK